MRLLSFTNSSPNYALPVTTSCHTSVKQMLSRVGIPAFLLFMLGLYSCTTPPNSQAFDPTEDISRAQSEAEGGEAIVSPTPSATPSDIPFPDQVVLGLESRWLSPVEAALSSLPADLLPVAVILQTWDPALEETRPAQADFLLLPDADGIVVTERSLALAVPWTSEWDQVTREEAEELLLEESPFIAAIEWSSLKADMKPLKIDGLHPSHTAYPLKSVWSLHARPGLEEIADTLASVLRDHLADDVVMVTAVGDIMLGRGLGKRIQTGEDPYPFAAVEHFLTRADVSLGNLESALGSGGQPEDKGYTFLAPPEAAETLNAAGFDVLSLANNHALDYGPQTLLEAMAILEAQDIKTVGAGADISQALQPVKLEISNISVAILAFVDVPIEFRGFDTRSWRAGESAIGVAWADPVLMRDAIERSRVSADIVIVLLHSGYEYLSAPSPPQQAAARLAIDSGADLVIGHHAHVLQGVEHYGDGVIVYGLGNFAFEDGGVIESGLMNIWLDTEKVRSLEFIPLIIAPDGQPTPADPGQSENIRLNYYSLSRTLAP